MAQTVYPPVLPDTRLAFPRDFGAHPDYRVEWWYLTGWLDDGQRKSVGFQLTFFRLRPGVQEGNRSAFAARQLLFAHAALADPDQGRLRHAEKSARAGFGIAAAATRDTEVGIDDWSLRRIGADSSPGHDGDRYVARVRSDAFAYELSATTTAPPLLQGDHGFSRKGRDPLNASHYYSRPQLAVRGWIEIEGRRRQVSGRAWLDHEWSSQAMPDGAVGWDWLGANLHDGGAVMAFRMRDAAGRTLWASATVQAPGQPAQHPALEAIVFTPLRRWRSPLTGGDYPVEMDLRVGTLKLRLSPLLDDQELDSRRSLGAVYWEGAVRVLAEDGRELGRGYFEMTGYVARLRM